MKIRLAEIPDGGLSLSESLSEGWLISALGMGETDAWRPTGPIRMELELERVKRQVEVRGKVRVRLAYSCSRCGEAAEQDLEVKIRETFLPAERFRTPSEKAVDLQEEDFANSFYENDEIELGRYLAESILLAFPMYPRCDRPACSEGSADYAEEWGVNERELNRNPEWQEGLKKVQEKLGLKKKRRVVKKKTSTRAAK